MRVFAHRGASSQFAEHTRAAFAHALTVGAHGVEADVHLSADGHLICWHDATLDRTSSGRGPVSEHTVGQLRSLDVHSWMNHRLPSEYGQSDDQLITLDQLTEMAFSAGRDVEIAVEMKHATSMHGALEDALLDWLDRWGWDAESCTLRPDGQDSQVSQGSQGSQDSQGSKVSVSVMSFSRESLRRISAAVPATMLCPLFEADDRDAVKIGATTRGGAAGLLGPSVRWLFFHGSVLRSWTSGGRTVRMWTVQTDDELATARELGVQQVTVNDPAWALDHIS